MKKYLLLLTASLALTVVHGQTNISGGNVSGTWTLAGSPYLVQGSIMIPNDSTLIIQAGVTISFQGQYKLVVLGRLLAIGTATDTIIFTASNATSGWRGVRFYNTSATNDTSKIIYCKLQYGMATGASPDDKGGALYFSNFSKAIISNSHISNGKSNMQGGAIYCNNSSPKISYNLITNNTTYWSGGGIYLETNSSPIINNNDILNNSTTVACGNCDGGGGGIGIYGNGNGNAIITNNVIKNNTTSSSSIGGGGGIYCSSNGTIISNNIISYNSTSSIGGGGIYCGQQSPIIFNNIISNNTAAGSQGGGGGICCYWGSSATISNNVIVNNTTLSSIGGGGGIYFTGGISKVTNNTVANNHAIYGGAFYCTNSSNPIFRNCILWGNTATSGGAQVFLNDEPSDPSFYYCEVQGGSAGFDVNLNIYTGAYQNNINTTPLFVSPSAGSGAGFNGVTANWSLQSGSPCIDVGDPLGIYPSIDLAGNPRLENVSNCAIDLGAYEYQSILCPNNNVKDVANDKVKIQIFPNPFSTQTTLQTDQFFKNTSLTIYNSFGQTVKRMDNLAGQTIVFQRDNLPSGLYFVRLTQDGNTISADNLVITDK